MYKVQTALKIKFYRIEHGYICTNYQLPRYIAYDLDQLVFDSQVDASLYLAVQALLFIVTYG